jgi:hypothetical protein
MSTRFSLKPAVLLCLFLTTSLIAAQAQRAATAPPPGTPCKCGTYRFTLQPGGAFEFNLPVVQNPVRIEVSLTANNGGTQTPSELMYAVVNQDPSSKQLTWIGTNSDGSTSGSNSLEATNIANIFGGASSVANASLNVASAASATLSITQNASTTIIPGDYVVRIYF